LYCRYVLGRLTALTQLDISNNGLERLDGFGGAPVKVYPQLESAWFQPLKPIK
jgi:Leucine-rich repeat (LRR) protein